MEDYPHRRAGAVIHALGAFATFLDLYDQRVPWSGLATMGLAVATGTARSNEKGVARLRGWRIALALACTVVIIGHVFGR